RTAVSFFLLLMAFAMCAPAATRRRAAGRTSGMAEVQRVMVVVLENEDSARAEQQPFLAQLAARGALLRDYHALTHPSQPNYIALAAGSAYGVDHDRPVTIDAPSGQYARKHVPFLDFADVQNDRERCGKSVVEAGQLDADIRNGTLPRFSLYVPNLRNDGHDTGVAFADAWLRQRFEPLLADE